MIKTKALLWCLLHAKYSFELFALSLKKNTYFPSTCRLPLLISPGKVDSIAAISRFDDS